MNEYFKRDYQHIKVRINEADNYINKYIEDGYRLLSTSQSEPEYLHLYFEKYVSIDELEDYEQSTQDKIIRATRKSNVTNEILLDTFAEKGLVGVYNLGLENMYDYLIKNPEVRKHGSWFLLDECANAGVYCSVCHKKVYKTDYANQKIKSKYCPNCGAIMDLDGE